MTSAVAIALVLLLFFIVAAPVALATRPGRIGNVATVVGSLAVVLVLAWNFGWFGGYPNPPVSIEISDQSTIPASACQQIRQKLKDARLLIDDSDPKRVVVNADGWREVPDQLRPLITQCFQAQVSDGTPVQIIQASGAKGS